MTRETKRFRQEKTTLTVTETQIESIRRIDVTEHSLRLYENGYIGVAGSLGTAKEASLEARARETLALEIPYPCSPSAKRTEEAHHGCDFADAGTFVETMRDLLSALRKDQPGFTFSNKITLARRTERLSNDLGLDLAFDGAHFSIALLFKRRDSGNILDGGVEYVHRCFDRDAFLAHVNEICQAFGREVPLPDGRRHPVVFESLAGGHGHPCAYFAKALHGQMFGQGASPLASKLGDRIYSENFTLFQSVHPADSFASFFDAEGAVMEDLRYAFVDKGVLKSPYTDKRTADTYDLPHSGNAWAEYDSVPQIACFGFRTGTSDATTRKLLDGRPAIFVVTASGGDYTSDGRFATPVQLAFLFDGERFLGRLPEFAITGQVDEMFGERYIGTGNDSFPAYSRYHPLLIDLDIERTG